MPHDSIDLLTAESAIMAVDRAMTVTHQPKSFTDLPNEVISRICEYLVPDRSEPKTFSDDEVNFEVVRKSLEGWSDFALLAPLRRPDRHVGTSYVPFPGRRYVYEFKVLLPSKKSKTDATNHLSNLALVCKSTEAQAQSILHRHTFLLTVSNEGITFEGFRDARPLQIFRGPDSYKFVNPSEFKLEDVPRGSIPDNTAFTVLQRLLGKIFKLKIHIELDLSGSDSLRTRFFLRQIAEQLTALQARDSRLENIEVSATIGLYGPGDKVWRDAVADAPTTSRKVPWILLDKVTKQEEGHQTIAEVAAEDATEVLLPLMHALQGHLMSKERFTSSLIVKGHGTGVPWGEEVHGYGAWSPLVKAQCGSFELFCEQFQAGLFGSAGKAPNTMAPGDTYTSQIGFPMQKLSKYPEGAKSEEQRNAGR